MNLKLTPNDPIEIPVVGDGFVSIDTISYAIRANANLGIKETGKTYAATWFAEQLMKRGIPIVAISPSPGRVWRYLKVGRPGFNGFPVVVVGDDADLPLNKDTAPDIMRAAMQEGVSVVFDIFSKGLSKTDWRKIVTGVSTVLLFENENYGLRHCFLEEGAEYVPQQVYDKMAYSAVEGLVRMGGNSGVGITMLNPRAEGINKSVLELCESLLLFKQTGRNSITNLGKWFEKVDTKNQREIIQSFMSLEKGQCWFWDTGVNEPVLVQIPEKDTVHPDRRALTGTVTTPPQGVGVSDFVKRMNKALVKQTTVQAEIRKEEKAKKAATPPVDVQREALIESLQAENTQLVAKVDMLTDDLRNASAERDDAIRKLNSVRDMLRPDFERMQQIFSEVGDSDSISSGGVDASKYAHWFPKLVGYQKDMLQALIDHKRLTRERLGLIIGKKVKGNGTFGDYVTALKSKGLVREEGNELVLVEL